MYILPYLGRWGILVGGAGEMAIYFHGGVDIPLCVCMERCAFGGW